MIGRIRAAAVAVVTLLAAAGPLAAQGSYFASDNLGYAGTVSCYTSQLVALSHVANCGLGTIAQRDLGLYFIDGNAAFANRGPANEAIFLTNWYSNNGYNPNNTNVGFVQMYDNDAGSVTSMSMGWDNSMTMFTLAASGANTVPGCGSLPPQDCGRLWDTGSMANGGTFLSWNVQATFTGFTQATLNAATGVYESSSEPLTVTGSLSALFLDMTTGRYYELNAAISDDSWAVANGFGTNTVAGAAQPVTATPEPASLALMATGLIGVGGISMRRRRKQHAI